MTMKYVPQHGPAPLNLKRVRRGSVAKRLRLWVYERDGFRCLDCGEDDTKRLTVDHLWPAVAGGTEMASNLETVCGRCNSLRKGAWDRKHGERFWPALPHGHGLLDYSRWS